MPLLLTQCARKERVRYLADLLKEPSSHKGECPHTIRSSVELLQYDRKNENDGRTFKYCNKPGCTRVQYTSEPLSPEKAGLLREYQDVLDQLYHTSKVIGEMETHARGFSKNSRSRPAPKRQRAPSARVPRIPGVVHDEPTVSSRIPRRPNRKSYMPKHTIDSSSNSRNITDLTGSDPVVSATSRAWFHGEQPAQERLLAMDAMYNGWRY